MVMLDAVSGRILRTVPVGLAPLALAVDTRSRRVFVVNRGSYDVIKFYTIRDGSLSVLDALTGTVLRTVPLPGNAGPAVVDEHTGRAFVVIHRRRPVGTVDPWGWIPSPLRRLLPFVPAPPTPGVADSVSVTMIDATR